MATIQRPLKEGSVRTYQEKVGLGFLDILASEMDADLDTIYGAWNGGLGANSIGSLQLIDGAVTSPKLATGAVGTRELADLGVATGDIANLAVNTAKLADGAVTWAKRGEPTLARVYRNTNLPTIANNALTPLTFDLVQINNGGMYTGTQTDRFTIQQTGYYVMGGSIEYNPIAGGTRRVLFVAIDAAIYAGSEAGQLARQLTVATGALLAAGQAMQLYTVQDSGAGLAVIASTVLPNMWIARVG